MHVIDQQCERARRWASVRLDGDLSQVESALLEAHLECCAGCRGFDADITLLTAALRRAPRERAPMLRLDLRRPGKAAARVLQAGTTATVLAVATAIAAIVGFPGHGSVSRTPQRVAMVASTETPDSIRRLRRVVLFEQESVPRNKGIF